MSDAKELLHNVHEVFSERNPDRRRTAIERTSPEDVIFIDPEGGIWGATAALASCDWTTWSPGRPRDRYPYDP
jgi:hypothetical protein